MTYGTFSWLISRKPNICPDKNHSSCCTRRYLRGPPGGLLFNIRRNGGSGCHHNEIWHPGQRHGTISHIGLQKIWGNTKHSDMQIKKSMMVIVEVRWPYYWWCVASRHMARSEYSNSTSPNNNSNNSSCSCNTSIGRSNCRDPRWYLEGDQARSEDHKRAFSRKAGRAFTKTETSSTGAAEKGASRKGKVATEGGAK